MRSAQIALRAAGVAVVLTAVSAATAPAALAGDDDRGSVSADPNPAEPGARVKLRVQGCDGDSASAKSSVFVADVDLSGHDGGRDGGAAGGRDGGGDSGRDAGRDGGGDAGRDAGGDAGRDAGREGGGDAGRDSGHGLSGDALISSRAEPGRHDIRIKCGGRDGAVRGSLQITAHHRQDPSKPYPHHSPVRPVHAGGGGMAAELAASAPMAEAAPEKKHHGDDGPGLPHTLIGAALAAAATLAVAGRALTLRRRRSGE
ncbi:hypothetical protein MTF65_07310 [Streptomyces sp. APSN-46.1]|uniref:hypothetical protein n=1 Tax=Streptomyces sp. APSN-46.1 TaxID=2929049 RepID=UPI001FB4841E|nr:hypothetical protein [Streptomyces sp. APSN-46.1]MCJ1677155.1 hypothetical protein [Streptomyces sp. APSN-46.1]